MRHGEPGVNGRRRAMLRRMRAVATLALVLVAGCYLSHERGDGGDARAADDAGRDAGTDGGVDTGPPGETCDPMRIAPSSGCTTVHLPPTGTTPCTDASGAAVSGPSFVAVPRPGFSMSVAVDGEGGSFGYGSAGAAEPCSECRSTSGVGIFGFEADSPVASAAATRYVLFGASAVPGYAVTVCSPSP